VTGGVDTHRDTNMAAALDGIGGQLGVKEFPTTPAGYRALLAWLASFGTVARVGVEGTGSYGAGLARYLATQGVRVIEIDCPNRQNRRRRGKSDPVDAVSAARSALSGDASSQAKARNGSAEAIRVLRVARSSACHDRTEALNQMRSLVCTSPDELREQLRDLSPFRLIERTCALRPGSEMNVLNATKTALRELGRRAHYLGEQMKLLNKLLGPLVKATAPALLARYGVGPDTAGALIVSAGDNPGRLHSEAAFAHLCGSSPIEASSGQVTRHRLNRGGDRSANQALWRIVLVRMSSDPDTKAYVERRTKEGKSKREIMRCLKRYVARELYPLLAEIAA
ncbi:MAG: transposase, partial [Actinomycetota bacterium]|nr:transposase [Actinomycetota bacterium]